MPDLSHKTSLKDISYYRTGGVSSVFEPHDISSLVTFLTQKPATKNCALLGLGSNTLVSDDPFDGTFILFRRLKKIKATGLRIYVEAGVENSSLAQYAIDQGLAGAEWMYGLPGQIGATIRMNARCYGGEISQIVKEVHTLDFSGQKITFNDPSMFVGYKDTIFMKRPLLVVGAILELRRAVDITHSRSLMDSYYSDRKSKGQFDYPSCGCVFKNNYSVGVPSGMLLEHAGCKNMSIGGAVVSPYHSNFIYNYHEAKAEDILNLSFLMQDAVYKKFGVWLDFEMELLGNYRSDILDRYRLIKNSSPIPKEIEAIKSIFNANLSSKK